MTRVLHHVESFPGGWMFKLAVLRLAAGWRSILTLIVGVLLAAVIGASVPLYTNAVAQVGMTQRIAQQPYDSVHTHTQVALDSATFGSSWTALNEVVAEQAETTFGVFGGWLSDVVAWGETSELTPVRDGQDIEGSRLKVGFFDHILTYSVVVVGDWPSEADEIEGADIEVVAEEGAAARLDLTVGDTIVLDQRGWDTSKPITARISGIIRAADQQQTAWLPTLLTTRASMERVMTEFIPQTRATVGWRLVFDHTALPFETIPHATAVLREFEKNLQSAIDAVLGDKSGKIGIKSGIGAVLERYAGEVGLLGAPFGLLLFQLGALVLFFLVVMGALVRRNERRELAVLQSRGVPDERLLALRTVETLVVCVLTVFAAVPIARQFLIWFMPLLTNVDHITLPLTPAAYFYAGLAGFAALIVLVLTLIPVLRRPLILAGGSAERSGSQTWWQRYYLDVILLIVGLGALWQLINSRSLLADTNGGASQADPLLLLVPTLLFFALGSISLRLFPSAMNGLARLLANRADISWTAAGWQVSREPLHYGRITLLLALAISIGWFAFSFQATMAQSQYDQAEYAVGSDVRLIFDPGQVPAPEEVLQHPQIEAVTPVTRFENVDVSTNSGRLSLSLGDILLVDAATFAETAYWRDDLGTLHVPEWAGEIPIPQRTISQPQKVGFWAFLETIFDRPDSTGEYTAAPLRMAVNMRIELVFMDEDGAQHSILTRPDLSPYGLNYEDFLGDVAFEQFTALDAITELQNDGWVYFEGDLNTLSRGDLNLQAIRVASLSRMASFAMFFDGNILTLRDLTFTNVDGEVTATDWFTSGGLWTLNLRTNLADSGMETEASDFADMGYLQVYWTQRNPTAGFTLLLDYPEITTIFDTSPGARTPTDDRIIAIPAIVSASFAEKNELVVGQKFTLFVQGVTAWYQAVHIVDYFPTLYDSARSFIVLPRNIVTYNATRAAMFQESPEELWLKLTPGTNIEAFLESRPFVYAASYDREHEALIRQTDLLTAGLIGLLVFAFLVGLTLSVVSLITYAALNIQARRNEISVLRALGFTRRRIILSLTLEQALVVVMAVLLGGIIGVVLSVQVLPTLSTSTTGTALTPPFLVRFDTVLFIRYALIVGAIFAVQLAASGLLLSRMTSASAPRLTWE